MNFRMLKKILLTCLIITISILILGGGAGYYTWYQVRSNPVETLSSPAIEPHTINLGDDVAVRALYRIPWGRKVVSAEVEAAPGLLQTGEPLIKINKYHWAWCEWLVEFKFKTYRTGVLSGGKMTVEFDQKHRKDANAVNSIPSCQVNEISIAAPELQVADAVAPDVLTQRERWFVYALGALGILIIVLLVIMFKRRKQTVMIPPWTLALQDIAELHHELRGGKLNLETGLLRLTDIVRIYLEKRFQLHTTRQTTQEFLDELSRPNGALPEGQRPFLSEFMTSADLVKFAKVPPDETMLAGAIDKAEILVNETKPVENSGGHK